MRRAAGPGWRRVRIEPVQSVKYSKVEGVDRRLVVCTYCGCESITVIGRFMAEHVDCVNALGELRRAVDAGEPARIRDRAGALAAVLDPHTRAEEVGLFAVMARQDEFGDHVRRLCAEHETLDALLARVADGDLAAFDALSGGLREHINREENGLFPAAAIALDGPAWDEVDELTPGPA